MKVLGEHSVCTWGRFVDAGTKSAGRRRGKYGCKGAFLHLRVEGMECALPTPNYSKLKRVKVTMITVIHTSGHFFAADDADIVSVGQLLRSYVRVQIVHVVDGSSGH